jgi:hypothetical protein
MTPEIDNVGVAILKGACNPEAKDLAVDLGQFELGAVFDESVLKKVPVIKSVIACRKTWVAIRDHLFLRKVAEFLAARPRLTEPEKQAFINEHLNDPHKAKKLGDSLVLILDRLDDMEKPQMIAKSFGAFARGKICFDIFRRLSAAIDIGFIGDLREFSKIDPVLENPPPRIDEPTRLLRMNLLRTGLTGIKRSTGITPITGVGFEATELGRVFKQCMNDANTV